MESWYRLTKHYPKSGMVSDLFAGHYPTDGWVAPSELPDLSVYPKKEALGFDTEFRYQDNIYNSQFAGLSICTPDGKKFYLPVGHLGGGNIDENLVRRWARAELQGRHLAGINFKDDVHVTRKWGLDLEELDCHLHDVAFQTALLDENRYKFNLEVISQEVLGIGKMELPTAAHNIFQCSASEIGPYAEQDAYLHLAIYQKQLIDIEKQNLNAACDLEDQLIYSTCAMERAGALLDIPKLDRWIKQVEFAHQDCILRIHSSTGLKINPNSTKDLRRLFDSLNIPYPQREEELGGDVTFEEEYIGKVKHPIVRACIAARKLHSLLSKYLYKYRKAVDSNGILRYTLHQLRGDQYGTVTGRYASARTNIQQVMKVESQLEEEEIAQWIVRELFLPEDGKLFVSADASQIEFRLFAHYSKSQRLIREYCDNPDIDFHQLVASMLGQKRKDAKHNNFAKIYAMGVVKLARRLGLHCDCGCSVKIAWKRDEHSDTCKMQKAFDLDEQYNNKFPEASKLSQQAMIVAKERGFVHTLLGRRRRYPTQERLHSALNAVIQGSAADVLKLKILETYNNRKQLELFLRFTVHDELDGDITSESKAKQWKELLESPISNLSIRVPILWNVKTGASWKETTL